VTRRTERVAEEIREEVARMIAGELKDPRIGFITVTRVEVTPDLRLARIHVGVLGAEADRKKSLEGLERSSGFLRREVGRRLRLKHSPELQFRYDAGLDATERVAQLLDESREPEGREPEE
jgi:ribosome-binding factor A